MFLDRELLADLPDKLMSGEAVAEWGTRSLRDTFGRLLAIELEKSKAG